MRSPPVDAHDFNAEVCLLSPTEGGRRTPVYNGIRWDFCYVDGADEISPRELYMIWPTFWTEQGQLWPVSVALPVGVPLRATFRILNSELRESLHRARLRPGLRFHCHEGPICVARGVVTQLTGLASPG